MSIVGGIARSAARAGAIGGNSSNEPRWHQITHMHEDVDSWNEEHPSDASNFSDAEHNEINRKRRKMHMQVGMMNKANIPTWMIERSLATLQQNEENAS